MQSFSVRREGLALDEQRVLYCDPAAFGTENRSVEGLAEGYFFKGAGRDRAVKH